jgi:hypothetical protein
VSIIAIVELDFRELDFVVFGRIRNVEGVFISVADNHASGVLYETKLGLSCLVAMVFDGIHGPAGEAAISLGTRA